MYNCSSLNRYSHLLIFFISGASLELIFNFFHIKDANIYRSIKKNLSTSEAERRFEAERMLFEKIQAGDDDMLISKQKTLALADISQQASPQPQAQPQKGGINLAARSLLAGGKYNIT